MSTEYAGLTEGYLYEITEFPEFDLSAQLYRPALMTTESTLGAFTIHSGRRWAYVPMLAQRVGVRTGGLCVRREGRRVQALELHLKTAVRPRRLGARREQHPVQLPPQCKAALQGGGARGVTLRARWGTLRAR